RGRSPRRGVRGDPGGEPARPEPGGRSVRGRLAAAQAMICTDWSAADQAALAALYGREHAWWVERLDWDTAESWREVETARRAGRLPGVVVADAAGRIDALGYCFLDDGVAQLAVSTTASGVHEEAATRALLDRAAA